MSQQSWLCTACGQSEASLFCFCNGSETFLCGNCLSSHFIKNPTRYHQNLPVTAYGQHRIPGYFERLQSRSCSIPKGREAVLKNIAVVDECMQQFVLKLDGIIERLTEYKQRTYEKLQRIRSDFEREINESISEIERTMHDDSPNLQSVLAKSIRNFTEEQNTLKFFTYQMDAREFPSSLDGILSFECSLISATPTPKPPPPASKSLPLQTATRVSASSHPFSPSPPSIPAHTTAASQLLSINSDTLKIYNLQTGTCQNSTLSVTFSMGTMFCPIDANTVICLGGKPEVNTAYLLDLRTAKLALTKAMGRVRSWPGVIKIAGFVYVFGGNSPSITACEKFFIETKVWTELRSMQYPRYAFSPCAHQGDVYLVDSSQAHKKVEIFNLISETFRLARLSLEGMLGNSVSFIIDSDLIVITSGRQLARVRLTDPGSNFKVKSVVLTDFYSGLCTMPPVRVCREVFWPRYLTGNVTRFNADTEVITENDSLKNSK